MIEQDFVEIPASISNGEEFYDWLHGKKMKQKIEIDIDVPDGYEFDCIKTVEYFGSEAYLPMFKEVKPAKKVIDLSCIVGSGIDCEFWNDGYFAESALARKLTEVRGDSALYIDHADDCWDRCRVRQSPHVHFWQGAEKCPLPDGLKVKLIFHELRFYERFTITGQDEFKWQNVIGFEVLGVAEGWRYEWEEECEE